MINITINKIADEQVEVSLETEEVTISLGVLNSAECLSLSTLLMDAAEDLLRTVDSSVNDILNGSDSSDSNNMIN